MAALTNTTQEERMSNYTTLDGLALDFERAKDAEKRAIEYRRECESALIAAVGIKEEGAKSETTQWYKVTTTPRMAYKLAADWRDHIPERLADTLVRTKEELNVTEYKKLATSHPYAFLLAAKGVVTEPSKPTIKVERIKWSDS
jgi:hypothetical protein